MGFTAVLSEERVIYYTAPTPCLCYRRDSTTVFYALSFLQKRTKFSQATDHVSIHSAHQGHASLTAWGLAQMSGLDGQ